MEYCREWGFGPPRELCGYLDKLFAIHAQPAAVATKGSSAIFLIGSPATNPLIKSFPKLSDQGIVITPMEGARSTVIVGGGSPQATLWAVYELAERWGVRYLSDRDAIPARSKFRMPNERVVMEPIFRFVLMVPAMWISPTAARAGKTVDDDSWAVGHLRESNFQDYHSEPALPARNLLLPTNSRFLAR